MIGYIEADIFIPRLAPQRGEAASRRARVDLLFMQQRMGLTEVSGLYLRDAIFLDEALRA